MDAVAVAASGATPDSPLPRQTPQQHDETKAESTLVSQFAAPSISLKGVNPESAAALMAAAADVTLVIDAQGVISDLAFGSPTLAREGFAKWLGHPWADTVTVESRPKVASLIEEALGLPGQEVRGARSAPAVPKAPSAVRAVQDQGRWRHLNHPASAGDVPILYTVARLDGGDTPRVVAFGRDMRTVAALQQRLVDAQQSMERDYWRLRHVETRYRLLFQMATEAVLILDASTQKVVEANPAAARLLVAEADGARKLIGKPFPDGFDAMGTQAIQTLLAAVRGGSRPDEVMARLLRKSADGQREFKVNASLFRQESTPLVLVRLTPSNESQDGDSLPLAVMRLLDKTPDGFVVTDLQGAVLTANPTFLELAQLGAEEQALGQGLDRWLGRPGVDFGVLTNSLHQHGSVRLFNTSLRGEHGSLSEVEVSAVLVATGEPPCMGFTIRHVGRRLGSESTLDALNASTSASVAVPFSARREAPRSVEQLTKLVGQVPLKQLVRESTELIEQLCIEAALDLTRDNRASAAEMLGLSRQSLYVKLRRYGLGDLDGNDSEPAA